MRNLAGLMLTPYWSILFTPLLTTHRPFYQSHLLHEKKKKYEKIFYIKLTLFK